MLAEENTVAPRESQVLQRDGAGRFAMTRMMDAVRPDHTEQFIGATPSASVGGVSRLAEVAAARKIRSKPAASPGALRNNSGIR